jgi:Ca2+-binding RTX toxin-like protein
MADFTLLTGSHSQQALTTGETGYLGSAAVISSFLGSGTAINLRIHGAVSGSDVGSRLSGTSNSLFVGLTGLIDSPEDSYGLTFIETGTGNSRLSNAGQMAGNTAAVFALAEQAAATLRIDNSGMMQGEVAGLLAAGAGRVQIDNSGTIDGFNYGVTVETPGVASNLGMSLTNRGTIEGSLFAVSLSDGVDSIVNRGLLAGNVQTGSASDTLDNRGGRIEGTVSMGAGQDFFDNRGGDVFEFAIDLGADDDIFRPGAGAETVQGGTGARDQIDLRHGAGGIIDLVEDRGTGLADGDIYSGFEVVLGSRNGADTIFGNTSANELSGLGGNDVINGGSGNDTLNGGAGLDTLTGGSGADTFIFNTALGTGNVDRFADFNAVADTIRLENAIFTGLADGNLAATGFVQNTTGNAADASDRIIYESDTGRLYFDSDGTGAATKVHFATLATGLTLTSADFFVF